MSKKGQVTVFIIIGLLLLLIAIVLFSARKAELPPVVERAQGLTGAEGVRKHAEACVADVTEKAVYYFGMIGGGITPGIFPRSLMFDKAYTIPTYYNKGTSYAPTKAQAERAMSMYVEQNLKKCIDFSAISGVKVEDYDPFATASIDPRKVSFTVRYPLRAVLIDRTVDVQPDYTAEFPVRLHEMLSIANELTSRAVKDDLYIHWDYMTEVTKRNFNITAYTAHDDSLVYKIIDLQNNLFKDIPYTLQFAVRIKTREG